MKSNCSGKSGHFKNVWEKEMIFTHLQQKKPQEKIYPLVPHHSGNHDNTKTRLGRVNVMRKPYPVNRLYPSSKNVKNYLCDKSCYPSCSP